MHETLRQNVCNSYRLNCFIDVKGGRLNHRRSQGGRKSHGSPKFLENIGILCFERRFSKQNSVIRLKSNILAPPKNFWTGYAAGLSPFVNLMSPVA